MEEKDFDEIEAELADLRAKVQEVQQLNGNNSEHAIELAYQLIRVERLENRLKGMKAMWTAERALLKE